MIRSMLVWPSSELTTAMGTPHCGQRTANWCRKSWNLILSRSRKAMVFDLP